jgi:ferredoxin-type protein NapG
VADKSETSLQPRITIRPARRALTRRNALQKLTAGLATLAAIGVPFAFARLLAPATGSAINPKTADKSKRNILTQARRNILRPPGALKDDSAFVGACIGCGMCGEVCPPRCIKFHTRGGGDNVNTPYIDASTKACILCNKCMEVCPTDALNVMPRQQIDMGIAQIDRTACYPWVDRGICGACVSICPLGEDAINFKQWGQYQPIVHAACVGCGLCVEICPHPSTPIWIVDRGQGTVTKHQV